MGAVGTQKALLSPPAALLLSTASVTNISTSRHAVPDQNHRGVAKHNEWIPEHTVSEELYQAYQETLHAATAAEQPIYCGALKPAFCTTFMLTRHLFGQHSAAKPFMWLTAQSKDTYPLS